VVGNNIVGLEHLRERKQAATKDSFPMERDQEYFVR
jgi:hypothetical protein